MHKLKRPKIQILKAGPATASELADTWAAEGAGDLLFGGLPDFFSGLESRIGSPDPKVFTDMMADHCSKADAQVLDPPRLRARHAARRAPEKRLRTSSPCA